LKRGKKNQKKDKPGIKIKRTSPTNNKKKEESRIKSYTFKMKA